MNKFNRFRPWKIGMICLAFFQLSCSSQSELEVDFKNPPTSKRPYVWWHWMGPNFSLEGITKDLEAMKEQGIGGATIFNITSAVQESQAPTQNNPWPHQTYRGEDYWKALKHAASEAQRLGMEVGLHNTVGYSTTGGPWVDEKRSMQRVLWSDTLLEGGKLLDVVLARPDIPDRRGWGGVIRKLSEYSNIGVVAMPEGQHVDISQVKDLSDMMDEDGRLKWDAPAGLWKIYRFISASTGYAPHPLPDELIDNKTFEVDKLSLQHTTYHWENVLNPLKEHIGEYLGKSFKHFLIDSYEAGPQSWSADFRDTFIKEKGYDPLPWMATLPSVLYQIKQDVQPKNIIGDSLQTARFEWDYRDVVALMFLKNGWAPAAEMINKLGCQLQFEPYGGTMNTIASVRAADIPMGEFWTPNSKGIRKDVSGAARAAGLTLIGAEAFTGAPGNSQWIEAPEYLKRSGDYAFLSGVNRLILHHWVHQPFDDKYKPGMSMGWWGTHFGRHQTWSEAGRAYFDYLSRCQVMLQRGEQVIDYLSVDCATGGDAITWRDFVEEASVVDGQVLLASGRKYRFVELPDGESMQPELLAKVYELLSEGAIFSSRCKPVRASGLKNYPECDRLVSEYAHKIWGEQEQEITKVGKGMMLMMPVDKVRNYLGYRLGVDECPEELGWVHRQDGDTDFFFIVNTSGRQIEDTLSFGVAGKQPELWNPYNGDISLCGLWKETDGRVLLPLSLQPSSSVFVVFRNEAKNHVESACKEDVKWAQVEEIDGHHVLITETSGKYLLQYASGDTMNVFVDNLPEPRDITGTWEVEFVPKTDESRFTRTYTDLVSWTESDDFDVRYFSGTAIYRIQFDLSEEYLKEEYGYSLDLGDLKNLAQVKLNGKMIGTVWHRPFVLSSSALRQALHQGKNELEIAVTNTWHNRLVGDEQFPEDMEWGKERHFSGKYAGRPLVAYPDWFLQNKERPIKQRKTFVIWNYFTKDSQLETAGLFGPVRLSVYCRKVLD